MKIKGKLQQQ